MVFYNIFLFAYKLLLLFASPFSGKASKMVSGRKKIFQNLNEARDRLRMGGPTFWFHCASLGEFEQARPLIEKIKDYHPDVNIVLTFFSPSGYEIRKNYQHVDVVTYLPFDSPENAGKLISLVEPDAAFFIKYEFWYHYLNQLQKDNIPVISVSTLLMPHFVPFRWYGGFYRKMLGLVNHYFAQDQQTKDLLHGIGIDGVTLAGDTRFDRVMQVTQNAVPISRINDFKNKSLIMIIGSSWPEDMKVLTAFIKDHLLELKFIIAPHNIEEKELQNIEKAFPESVIRFSRTSEESKNEMNGKRVLLIDNIGMLTSLYAYGDIAYVGGAFGKGLHNTIEPAVFGLPVFFGNKYFKNFREAVQLIEKGGAFPIANAREMEKKCAPLITDTNKRIKAGEVAREYVTENTGASDIILNYLKDNAFLPQNNYS